MRKFALVVLMAAALAGCTRVLSNGSRTLFLQQNKIAGARGWDFMSLTRLLKNTGVYWTLILPQVAAPQRSSNSLSRPMRWRRANSWMLTSR